MRHFSNTAQEANLQASINASSTTIAVSGAAGFPSSTPYTLVLDPETGNEEIVTVTSVSGTNLTVVRGEEDTAAVSHDPGAVVRHYHTARDFAEPQSHIEATSGVHGVAGALVGAAQAQTLTNKDLSSPTNTYPADVVRDADLTGYVSTTGVATLTNKNLTSGTNTFPSTLATTTTAQALSNKDLSAGTNTFPSSLATDAEVNTATKGGSGRAAVPFVKLTKNADQSLVADSDTQVNWQVKDEESDAGFGDLTADTLTPPVGGLYMVSLNLQFTNNATGIRRGTILLDGMIVAGATASGNASRDTIVSAAIPLRLSTASVLSFNAVTTSVSTSVMQSSASASAVWLAP